MFLQGHALLVRSFSPHGCVCATLRRKTPSQTGLPDTESAPSALAAKRRSSCMRGRIRPACRHLRTSPRAVRVMPSCRAFVFFRHDACNRTVRAGYAGFSSSSSCAQGRTPAGNGLPRTFHSTNRNVQPQQTKSHLQTGNGLLQGREVGRISGAVRAAVFPKNSYESRGLRRDVLMPAHQQSVMHHGQKSLQRIKLEGTRLNVE